MDKIVAPDGTFIGHRADGVVRFDKIRYATCERFGEPQPFSRAGIEVDTAGPVPICPQNVNLVEQFMNGGINPNAGEQLDDALFLSVCVPDTSPSEPLPVMVYIYGGAFKSGGIGSGLYDGAALCREGNVIFVLMNYRVGFCGFVRDREGRLANLGMLDQMEALRWVRRNIAAFGGDIDNVTIFGQSAGAASVQYLLATEAAGTLFQRAIMMSSCFGALPNREVMDEHYLKLANEIPPDATLDQVLVQEALAMKTSPEKGNPKYCAFAPRTGIAPLPEQADLQSAWDRAAAKVTLMLGSAQRETSLYLAANPKLSRMANIPVVKTILSRVLAAKTRDIFVQGAHDFARAYAQAGGTVYEYESSWGVGQSPIGGCHCSEVPLVLKPLGDHDRPLYMGKSAHEVEQTGRRMRAIWSGFARDGQITDTHIDGCIDIRKIG